MRVSPVRTVALCLALFFASGLLAGEPLHVRVLPGGGGNNDFRVPGLTEWPGADDNGIPISPGGLPPIGDIGGYDGTLSGPGFGFAGPLPTPPGGSVPPRVPEPSSGLLALGAAGLFAALRRRSR